MSKIDPIHPDTAFVRIGTPFLSEVMRFIEGESGLSPTRRRDMLSGLRRVAKALNRDSANIPADPNWLQPRLAQIQPAALGIRDKSWSNAVSDARAALAHCKIVETRKNRPDDLSPEWQVLWQMILTSGDSSLQRSLSRFIYFLSRHDVSPPQVGDTHADAFLEAVTANEISKSPETAYRTAVASWNRAVKKLPDWPQVALSLPARVERISLPIAAFPRSFRQDVQSYVQSLTDPDPFDPLARSFALRPATVAFYRKNLVRFASLLVKHGTPIQEIVDLGYLVRPEVAERGFRLMLKHSDQTVTRGIAHMAGILRTLAERYVRVGEAELKTLQRLTNRLQKPPQKGMTDKNRARLRTLQNRPTLRKLLGLPEKLFASSTSLPRRSLLNREEAIAIAILQYCPIRVGNLAKIDIERHLERLGDGRVFLVFQDVEVKNKHTIHFELPASVVRMIDQHVASRSPELCTPGTSWLFPKRDSGGPISPGHLSERIKKRIRQEIGIVMNAHLFRHMAAMLWLERNPGAYEAARRLLGHSIVSQTLDLYTDFEADTATRLFADIIDQEKRA